MPWVEILQFLVLVVGGSISLWLFRLAYTIHKYGLPEYKEEQYPYVQNGELKIGTRKVICR